MSKLTFYPLGNADCCLIDLDNGKKVLFDFGAQGNPDDKDDKRIDLPAKLREDLEAADKSAYEIVAITHLDDDHTCKADEFFYFDHSKTYQSDERIKIDVLWVPAGVITESRDGLEPGAKAIQAEARYRLKEGYGIRVFSRPEALVDWLKEQGLTLKSRQQFITDAGNLAPELTLEDDGVEFFVHSPFGWRQDECTVVDRNRDSLVMQAKFQVDDGVTRVILGSDIAYDAISDIVTTTKKHKREERLEWDVFKLPHHCSYKTIGPERGRDKTKPEADVEWLFETQGHDACIIVSPSKPIPTKGTEEDKSDQPPHRQAKAYYCDEVVSPKDGEFLVTMEHPKVAAPEPIEIGISSGGATVKKRITVGAAAATSGRAPRAG